MDIAVEESALQTNFTLFSAGKLLHHSFTFQLVVPKGILEAVVYQLIIPAFVCP